MNEHGFYKRRLVVKFEILTLVFWLLHGYETFLLHLLLFLDLDFSFYLSESSCFEVSSRPGQATLHHNERENKAKEREIHGRESKKLGQILVAFAFFSHELGLWNHYVADHVENDTSKDSNNEAPTNLICIDQNFHAWKEDNHGEDEVSSVSKTSKFALFVCAL